MILKELINRGISLLAASYPETEARAMVAGYLEDMFGIGRHAHILDPSYSVEDSISSRAETDFCRMAAGEPLQYVTGRAYFYGRDFRVAPGVLIPRPETELLCREAVTEARRVKSAAGRNPRILDMCTGSGCIAWTLALELPGTEVIAVDLHDPALDVALSQDFSSEMSISGACSPRFVKADVLSAPMYGSLGKEKFDIIVSNPPYVMESEKKHMRSNVLDHEPHTALFGGMHNEKHTSKPGGMGIVEINEALGEETASVFKASGFYDVCVIRDLSMKDRFVTFRA